MTDIAQTVPSDPLIRAAGGFAIVTGIVSAVGVVFLILLYILAFATPYKTLGYTFGLLNDICVAAQYLLTIPIALALYRILRPYNPTLTGIATVIGVVAMLVVIVLQMMLVFEVMTFQRQVIWASLSLLVIGGWLVTVGYVARSVDWLVRSVPMGYIGASYFGFPVWAFWLGRHLLGW